MDGFTSTLTHVTPRNAVLLLSLVTALLMLVLADPAAACHHRPCPI